MSQKSSDAIEYKNGQSRRRGDAFLPADHVLGVLLVQRHAHVSAAERLGNGHGQ